jgi:ABC-type bacteriocin/lantibiotic exporter with double-glycine peptidase domain
MTMTEGKHAGRIVFRFLFVGLILLQILAIADRHEDARRQNPWMPYGIVTNAADVVLQKGSIDCGPAALKMIFEHFGMETSLREIQRQTLRESRGATMLALKEEAERGGLIAEGWRLDSADLTKERFPAILFINGNHFVVADSLGSSGRVYLRDPACGKVTIQKKYLMNYWKGESLVFRTYY